MQKWAELAKLLNRGGSTGLIELNLHGSPAFSLTQGDSIFTIGSCFARNIEERLESDTLSFPVRRYPHQPHEFEGPRPSGILNKFTPDCMDADIAWLYAIEENGADFEEETRQRFSFPLADGTIIDTGLQGYIPVSEARFWERRRDIFELHRELYSCNALILTLGLFEQWYYKDRVVQHAPTNRAMLECRQDFSFKQLSVSEIEQTLNRIVKTVQTINPQVKIIFTVSPVPMLKTWSNQHVYVANQLSKSSLLVSAHNLSQLECVDYFPSYEIVSLIGQQAFEQDRRHVRDEVVAAICQYFYRIYLAQQ